MKHNSSYAAIIIWSLTGQAIAPFVSAWTIKDGDDGINGKFNALVQLIVFIYSDKHTLSMPLGFP